MEVDLKIQNKKFIRQINYVFDFVFKHLDIESFRSKNYKDKIIISYGKKIKNRKPNHHTIHIYESNEIFSEKNYLNKKINNIAELINVEKLDLDQKEFIQDELPILFNNKSIDYPFKQTDDKLIEVNIDIVSTVFFMLTRYEEYFANKKQLDKHDRFPARESLAYKNGFLDRPIVDEYLELFRQIINMFDINCTWKNSWNDHQFGACLTHDVDYTKKFKGLSIAKSFIKNLRELKYFKSNYKLFRNFLSSKINYYNDPYWTFDYIIQSENKYNFNSSFYFMVNRNDKFDCDYDIKSNKIKNLIKKIKENDNEVGFHPNYSSYNKNSLFKDQALEFQKILEPDFFGGRQHYLRFDIKKTFELYNENNILYDSTLGYADYSGFRCGTSHPYKVYSLSKDKKIDLWEIPLITMEVTLRSSKYMDLSIKEALKYVKYLVKATKKYNGVFTLLWHNNNLTDDWESVYEEILNYIYVNKAEGLTGKEIIRRLTLEG